MRIREERRRRRHTYRETWIGSSSWNENCSRTISRINYWSTIYNLFTIRSPTIVAGRDSARAYARPSAHRIHAYERSKCRQTNWSFFYQSATTVWGKQLSTRGGGAFTGARTGHRFFSPPRFSRGISLLCTPSNISTTLDRSLITILRHRTTEPTFRFGSRTADREESRTKLHATSTTRSGSDNRAEVAGLNEYQGTINALRGNIDTLAQILQYIVTT